MDALFYLENLHCMPDRVNTYVVKAHMNALYETVCFYKLAYHRVLDLASDSSSEDWINLE
jgi:hypothetical protein